VALHLIFASRERFFAANAAKMGCIRRTARADVSVLANGRPVLSMVVHNPVTPADADVSEIAAT
jgi:hypothetical protein